MRDGFGTFSRRMFGMLLLAVCAAGTPDWLSPMRVAAAEEVHGESQLLLQVARPVLIQERLDWLLGEVRGRLREARIAYHGLRADENRVYVNITHSDDIEKARAALAHLLVPVSSDVGEPGTFGEVVFFEPEPGQFIYTLTDAGIDRRVVSAADKSVEILYRRTYELHLERVVEREGADRIRVQVTGRHDPEHVKVVLATRGKLTMQLVDTSMPVEQALDTRPPMGSSILYSTAEPPLPYLVENRVLLSGDHIIDAFATDDQYTGQPVVALRFDSEGTQLFAEVTQQNVGRLIAVVLDEEVIMAPMIREPVTEGSVQISGNFTTESARDAAVLLRTGELPAMLNVIEQRFKPAE